MVSGKADYAAHSGIEIGNKVEDRMQVEPIGAFVLLLGILILMRGPNLGFYILVVSNLLVTCAALFVTAIGGAPVQPAHLLLGFVTLAMLAQPGTWSHMSTTLAFPREGFWFMATAVCGMVGAILFPRIFAGAVYVSAISSSGDSGPALVPLAPTTGNLTQSIYFFGDLGYFLICYAFASRREGFDILARAFFAYCCFNIMFAFLDLATFWTNTSFLLDFMRNTSYAILDDTVINGLKRINGSFTEASSFGSATLGTFGYSFRLWLGGVRPALTLAVALVSLVLLIFCTATTAYAALPVLLTLLYGTALWRLIRGPVPKTVMAFLLFAPLLFAVITVTAMLIPAIGDQIWAMLKVMLFDKGTSQSAIERGSWNQAGINLFFATYGLGGGIGSVRTSSFPVAVISNLGVAGALTYGLFIAMVLLKPAPRLLDWYVHEVRAAARFACVACLITASISSTLIDLGLSFYMLAALACAANVTARTRGAAEGEKATPYMLSMRSAS